MCTHYVTSHQFEASAQAMEASSSSQSRNEEQAVLQNLLTDSDAKPALHAIHEETDSIAKQRERNLSHTYSAAQPVGTITLRVLSACTGEHMFEPLQVHPTDTVGWLLRRLQHLCFMDDPHGIGKRIQLTWNDRILDPSELVSHLDLPPSKVLVLSMIADPVLLSWDQLVAMPAMRKRAGRGGKGACRKQRQLRVFCFENNIREVDLSSSDYNWRLLLKTMPCLNRQTVIGPGVVKFAFRLLDETDWNYVAMIANCPWFGPTSHAQDMGERHVFEISCANGHQWHVHFHKGGSCDLKHVPFIIGHGLGGRVTRRGDS
jgi:hypothetical protein